MKSITKDIARALGLSTSTVSRALRDSYEISPDNKPLVIEYADRFNYRPNSIALSLKENRSRIFGVIVPQIANNSFSEAINGIEAAAYSRGYSVFIFQSHESYERELVAIQQAVDCKDDRLLISLSSSTSDVSLLRSLQQRRLPIVLFDRVSAEVSDAFLAASDRLSIGCLAALEKRNVAIPQTMSLIGFTNTPVADLLAPSLSTVEQAAWKMGQLVATQLIDLIEGKNTTPRPGTVSIPTRLVFRTSSQ